MRARTWGVPVCGDTSASGDTSACGDTPAGAGEAAAASAMSMSAATPARRCRMLGAPSGAALGDRGLLSRLMNAGLPEQRPPALAIAPELNRRRIATVYGVTRSNQEITRRADECIWQIRNLGIVNRMSIVSV